VFTFNETQESRLNDLGMNMLDSTNNLHLTSDAISSIPKRLGLIFFRMAMVLTCVRNYGPEVEVPTTLECSDDDFDICMTLIPLFLQHSLKILEQLPGEIESRGAEQAARQLLRELPTGVNLTRPEIENCSSTRLSRSALSKYLKILVRLKLLTSPIHGVYVKPA
jgi:hypothetical protein